MVADERRFRIGPDGLHCNYSLTKYGPTRLSIHPVIGNFLDVPARTDAQREPSPRNEVDARNLLRENDRIARWYQTHPNTDAKSARCRQSIHRCNQRIDEAPIFVRQFPAAWVRRIAGDRNVGVIREQQQIKVGRLAESSDRSGSRRLI